MFHRRQSDAATSRGQALVEFAIILPVLALLLVMALDFGRVFFGWIGLQTGVRAAADFAASNAETWPDEQDLYRNLVINDMQAINCEPPPALDVNGNGFWDLADVPDPTFEDVNANGQFRDDGDYANVVLSCRFDVLTPLAGAIVGSPVALGAEASFPINQILVPAIPTPEPTPPLPCPSPVAAFTLIEDPPSGPGANATDGRGATPLRIDFTDTSTDDPDCPISSFAWEFGGATVSPATSTDQNPQDVTFTHPTGSNPHVNFIVKLTVSNDDGQTNMVTKTIRVDP
jgi:hypothetical protein